MDNRLSWFLGRLDRAFGDDAFYVHLKRDDLETARSFLRRYDSGIVKAYRTGILMGTPRDEDPLHVCLDYCETVNANIEAFLKDKTKKINVALENAKEDFRSFWDLIRAEGDLAAALSEWDTFHNASGSNHKPTRRGAAGHSFLARLARRARRAVGGLRSS